MALDPVVVENFYKFQKDFNIGIELEVAYDPLKDTFLNCFIETRDKTITSSVEGAELAEFVLDYGFRKYFQHKEKIDKEISDILSMSYTNNGSCGTHVHISHPSIKNGRNEDFLIYLDYYWVYYSQDKIKMKYPQVRHDNDFAEDNKGWLLGDTDNRNIQMNIQNASIDRDDLAHVEFRGYNGLPNGELSTFRARIQMKMLSFYIEDLCDEYTKAYFSFKQGIPCIPIETLNEITAKKVEEIMDMYYGDTKPPWDGKYQLDKIETLMHYIGLDTTSQDILSAYEYYDSKEERSITHNKPLIIKLLKYFTKWCEEPDVVVYFLKLVPEKVWVKNQRMIKRVIGLYTRNDEGGIKPEYMVVHNFVLERNNVPTRGRRAKSKGRQKAAAPAPTPALKKDDLVLVRLRGLEQEEKVGKIISIPYPGYRFRYEVVFDDGRTQSCDKDQLTLIQSPEGDADSGSASSSASSSASPAHRGRLRTRSRGRTRRRVDGGDPLRDLRLRF